MANQGIFTLTHFYQPGRDGRGKCKDTGMVSQLFHLQYLFGGLRHLYDISLLQNAFHESKDETDIYHHRCIIINLSFAEY